MQLNGAQGRIYLTITFAALIFMIKTIRHLWVACARALRLTTVVKRAAIRGFTRMSESSVCATARPARGNVITPGYDANTVSNESTTDNRICTYCSPFLFFFLLLLFSLERHIFDGKPPVLHSSQVGQLCAHLAVLKDSLYSEYLTTGKRGDRYVQVWALLWI